MNINGDPDGPRAAGTPSHLLIIAGRGVYPLELARYAREDGVARISAIAFRGETDRAINRVCDGVRWIPLGSMNRFLETAAAFGATDCVLAGQITPANLFTLRLDARALDLIRALPERNAHTLFGAVVRELSQAGLTVHPASLFMGRAMPAAGLFSRRAPDAREQADIALGRRVVRATSTLDIGQTVVIKQGTILAVEAFEGTDNAIRRGGRLGGAGAVVVKTAKPGHDMRFDIPIIGRGTLKSLRRIRARALAIEAGRAILLDRERVRAEADRDGLAIVVFPGDDNKESPA